MIGRLHDVEPSEAVRCESTVSYEDKFIKLLSEAVVEMLNIGWNDRRIVSALLETNIKPILCGNDGLLDQYLNCNLDILARSFRHEFDLSGKVKAKTYVNYDYAVHARFNDIIEAIKPKIKHEDDTPSTELKDKNE